MVHLGVPSFVAEERSLRLLKYPFSLTFFPYINSRVYTTCRYICRKGDYFISYLAHELTCHIPLPGWLPSAPVLALRNWAKFSQEISFKQTVLTVPILFIATVK